MMDESFLTTEEVLEYLQVNLRTVYRLIKAGKIPAVRVGRQWRFRKRDIDAWLETPAAARRRARRSAGAPRPTPRASGGRPRVLVVDDEATIRDLLAKTLALAEYDVDMAPDGRTALERLRIIPYDLLITDLKMPGVDGLTVIREARRLKADLPVIIITGFSTEASAIEAVNLGVSGYLTKPFRVPRVLGRRVLQSARRRLKTARSASHAIQLDPHDPASSHRKSFGDRVLLDAVTWQIDDRERVGLSGPNGAGKTTLLKMLAGHRRARRRARRQAGRADDRLPAAGRPASQRPHAARRGRPRVQAAARHAGARSRASRTRSATTRCRDGEHETMLVRYSELQDEFRRERRLQHRSEGHARCCAASASPTSDFEQADRDVLRRLADAHRAGQAAARAARACCCSTSRPTTSISTRATGSRNTSPTIRTPSSSSRTIASSSTRSSRASPRSALRTLTDYVGNYSDYLVERDARMERLRQQKRDQDEEIARMQAFINRFRYQATKAAQVQSRIKMLDKIVPIEIPPERKRVHFTFPAVRRRAAGRCSS